MDFDHILTDTLKLEGGVTTDTTVNKDYDEN